MDRKITEECEEKMIGNVMRKNIMRMYRDAKSGEKLEGKNKIRK